MSILINVLLVILVLICLLLILLVLMQRPKNEGLGAAFGGGMTENLFGAQTTNVLQTMTRNLGIAFFIVSGVLGWLTIRNSAGKTSIHKELSSVPALVATPAPVPPSPDGVKSPTEAPSAPVGIPGTKPGEGDKNPETSGKDSPVEKPTPEGSKTEPKPGSTPPPPPASEPAKGDPKPAEPPAAPDPAAPKPSEPPKL